MADVVSNRAKGAAHQLALDNGAAFQVILLKEAEADATIVNYGTVALMLAEVGNTEADFTNYARKTGITVTVTQDDENNRVDLDIPDQTFTDAGGASNNNVVKAVVCVQTGADDTSLIPLTYQDYAVTTDGSTVTIEFDAAGFYRAA